MAKLNEYMTVGEAAVLLGVSKDTLRRWDRAGKLKARRHPITGYRLYVRKELDLFLRGVVGTERKQPAKKSKKKARKDG